MTCRSSPGRVEGGQDEGEQSCSTDKNAGVSTAIGVPRHSLPGCDKDDLRFGDGACYTGANVGAWGTINAACFLLPGHVEGRQEGNSQTQTWDANHSALCLTGGPSCLPIGGLSGGVGTDEGRANQAHTLEANSCALYTIGGLVCPTSGGGRDVEESLRAGNSELHTFHEEEESSGEDESLSKG